MAPPSSHRLASGVEQRFGRRPVVVEADDAMELEGCENDAILGPAVN